MTSDQISLQTDESLSTSCHAYDCSTIEWRLISGGDFTMGVASEDPHDAPMRNVSIDDFELTMYEVTVGQYRQCVVDGICALPVECDVGRSTWTDQPGDQENLPVNCVSKDEAMNFAHWAGGELPTEVEWEYAARNQGRDVKYPWGDMNPECSFANFQGCTYQPIPVCAYALGATEEGLCDMGGNLLEWVTEDPLNMIAFSGSLDGITRGGSWIHSQDALRTTYRFTVSAELRTNFIGFRLKR